MSFSTAMKTFWHAMTSDDRHATFNSPYRAPSGHGVGRNPELSSVSSRLDGAPYQDDLAHAASRSSTALASSAAEGNDTYSPRSSSNNPASPTSPYSPGSRSNTARAKDGSTISGIPLQDFSADGSPPPPPAAHSWRRIDRWAEDNYPELWDQLAEGATINDINELEHDLDCSLPMDVRESLQVHDGQERGGMPTGIIFGAMLLDCEEITDEWNQWQLVRAEYLQKQQAAMNGAGKPMAGSSGGSSSPRHGPPNGSTLNKAVLMSRQDSQPDGAVQKVYCHPGWIPLVRDWGGNNIGIDLAPGPAGKWGQVILFGRDYDCKYVVAKSWSSFLANVADDLESSNWYVDEDTGELKLRELKSTKVEPGYLDILRLRCDKKYGRKMPPHMRRRPGPPQMPHVATGNGPVGPRPGPGTTSPGSPMIGLSPIVRPDGSREAMPSKTLSPIHAPKAVKPIGRVLDEPLSATASGSNTPTILTPARTSLQSTRSTETPPPLIIDASTKKKDDLEDLSDLISTPTSTKPADGFEKKGSGANQPSKEVNSLADTLEDVDLGKGK